MPELTQELADNITRIAVDQLRTSRDYKQVRMDQIKKSENLYAGVVKKQLKNPFNIPFPFMSGFVDHFLSKIDDPPTIEFTQQEEADFILSQKLTSAFENEVTSTRKGAKWALKDRWAKKLALFQGRGIYQYSTDKPDGKYKSNFDVIDLYDFHFEPDGGGHLENHLFCGKENIFKTKEELEQGMKEGKFDRLQTSKLITNTSNEEYKDNMDSHANRYNRQRAMGQDPESHNFVGQNTFRLNEWYLTHKGVRWYVLFDEVSNTWIRVKPLKELFSSERYPFITWATNEDARNFLSKAPCDDARPVGEYINTLLNQELYNREKQNRGVRAYDAEMFNDVKSLASWRPDQLIPVDTKGGKRPVNSGIFQFNVAGLNGSLDLVSFLDGYVGQKTGSTPSSQGAADKNKKVGIFFGELQQVDEFIGTKNKSYREAWAEIGARYIEGLDDNLDSQGIAIKLMGAGGIEWATLKKGDMARQRELDIKVTGGSEQAELNELESRKKAATLGALATVNPKWRDEQLMKVAGFNPDEIKQAFSQTNSADEKLMSQAAQSIQDIIKKKTPKLNQSANAAFMQKIIDFAKETDVKPEIFDALTDYAMAHVEIATENEARTAINLLSQRERSVEGIPQGQELNVPAPQPEQSPQGQAISVGQRATNAVAI